MTVVNTNSFSGINSITAQETSVTFYKPSGGLADIIGNFSSSYASQSEIVGVNTTASTTSGSTTVTLSGSGQAANISNGFSVAGRGITPGTTVSSGGGTTNLVLSQNAGITSTTNPLTFYTNSKVVSPGGVGGMLCRAWVNFNGTGVSIRSSYNVSSVTSNGNGDYTVTFITSMPDPNYCCVCSASNPNGDTTSKSIGIFDSASSPTVSSVRLLAQSSNGNNVNVNFVNVSIFR